MISLSPALQHLQILIIRVFNLYVSYCNHIEHPAMQGAQYGKILWDLSTRKDFQEDFFPHSSGPIPSPFSNAAPGGKLASVLRASG
jgi:hypothetical protein